MPPQPQLLGQACPLGKPLNFDDDQGPSHQRPWATRPPLGMILWDGMQIVPSAHLHLTILGVLGDVLLIGFWPGGRIGTGEFVSMSWRPPRGSWFSGIGVKAASSTQAREG